MIRELFSADYSMKLEDLYEENIMLFFNNAKIG